MNYQDHINKLRDEQGWDKEKFEALLREFLWHQDDSCTGVMTNDLMEFLESKANEDRT